jgi:hypothetical protein
MIADNLVKTQKHYIMQPRQSYQFIISLLFFCWLLPCFLSAQPAYADWEHRFGGNSSDQFHQLIEATNGYLIAVGQTASNAKGKLDGLLCILDFSTGQPVIEKRIGGDKEEAILDVIQSPDGYFYLAGYTSSYGKGKKDGWLVKVDEKGTVLWEKTFGSTGDDIIEHLSWANDEKIIAVGQKNGGKQGDIWVLQINGQELYNSFEYGKGQYDSRCGLVSTLEKTITIAGNTGGNHPSGKGNAYLLNIGLDGTKRWEKSYGDKAWEEANQLIATPDGGYAIAGLSRSDSNGGLDMWLIKVNKAGFRQWEKSFGGKDDDMAQSVTISTDGGYLLAGRSKSYHSGARSYKAYLVKVSAGGQLSWEWDYGGNKDDSFQSIISLHNGHIVAAGSTASNAKGAEDAWILKAVDQASSVALPGAKQSGSDLSFSEAILKTVDGKLRPGERSHISFTVFNESNTAIPNLQTRVEQLEGNEGLRFWSQNYFGTLDASDNQTIHIPVYGTSALGNANNTLKISVLNGDQVIKHFTTTVESKQPIAATVEVDNYTFEDSKNSDTEVLSVVLHNPGDFTVKPVVVNFNPPPGIQAISPRQMTLPQLTAHASKTIKFSYKRSGAFRSGSVAIPCTVDFNGQKITKTLERGRSMSNEVFMVLTQPNETSTDIKGLISNKGVFDVQVAVGSSTPLKQKNFKVLNNSIVIDGSKMDEVSLSDTKSSDNKYAYVYNNKITLQPGENKVEIEVETPEGKFRTKTIIVQYEPRQPNLHLLAIGPTHQDLSYTAKDAADFADAFKQQAGDGKIFKQVFIRKMVGTEDTKADDIREAMADMVYQYENATAAKRILDQDVLIVFISSHGKNSREGFQLLPSNYDPRYERIRSISFQNDIVQELERIQCKKVVLIDACHSGAADSKALSDVERAAALTQLAALHPGLNTMASCGANEMSYEDQSWENGAFTEAILDAFANRSIQGNDGNYRADANGDSIITLDELYTFLRLRVPSMVRQQKPSAPTGQTPFMPGKEMNARQIPIYVID